MIRDILMYMDRIYVKQQARGRRGQAALGAACIQAQRHPPDTSTTATEATCVGAAGMGPFTHP